MNFSLLGFSLMKRFIFILKLTVTWIIINIWASYIKSISTFINIIKKISKISSIFVKKFSLLPEEVAIFQIAIFENKIWYLQTVFEGVRKHYLRIRWLRSWNLSAMRVRRQKHFKSSPARRGTGKIRG